MVAQQPQNGIRTILPTRHRCIARALLALGLRQPHLGIEQLQLAIRVAFRLVDLLAAQLSGLDRVETLDALRGVAIGDRLHLERMQLAELGHLVE
jgi:hypothetical protein